MPMQRLFIIAPSLARLIRKERGSERVQEGYFPTNPSAVFSSRLRTPAAA
jgi:hypothetical protein